MSKKPSISFTFFLVLKSEGPYCSLNPSKHMFADKLEVV